MVGANAFGVGASDVFREAKGEVWPKQRVEGARRGEMKWGPPESQSSVGFCAEGSNKPWRKETWPDLSLKRLIRALVFSPRWTSTLHLKWFQQSLVGRDITIL